MTDKNELETDNVEIPAIWQDWLDRSRHSFEEMTKGPTEEELKCFREKILPQWEERDRRKLAEITNYKQCYHCGIQAPISLQPTDIVNYWVAMRPIDARLVYLCDPCSYSIQGDQLDPEETDRLSKSVLKEAKSCGIGLKNYKISGTNYFPSYDSEIGRIANRVMIRHLYVSLFPYWKRAELSRVLGRTEFRLIGLNGEEIAKLQSEENVVDVQRN